MLLIILYSIAALFVVGVSAAMWSTADEIARELSFVTEARDGTRSTNR